MGIVAPSGASAVAHAGGSLALGDYKVYVSYCRTVGGVNRLYSVGESLGTVTLAGGNQTIRITLANSADTQVNNKVVWMTDADGSVVYFYHETGDNTTTTIDVTSDTNKNSALLYSTVALNNDVPPNIEWIFAHNNRLIGSIDNVVYYNCEHIPSLVGNTATNLLTDNTFPYILEIANKGVFKALTENDELNSGASCYKGKITHKYTAQKKNLQYFNINDLINE